MCNGTSLIRGEMSFVFFGGFLGVGGGNSGLCHPMVMGCQYDGLIGGDGWVANKIWLQGEWWSF